MIIRALPLPQGRLALSRPASFRSSRRWSSSPALAERTYERTPNPFESTVIAGNLRTQSVSLNDPNHPVAQDYELKIHQRNRTQHLGSVIDTHYKPHELVSNPPSSKDITLELLMASQSHIGHATCLWNPVNAQYIFGIHGDDDPIHIISLDVTATHLRRAAKIVSGVTERGGLVLFVGTREGQARSIIRAAQLAKGCHLFKKWIPGSITNGQLIVGRCDVKVVDENDQEVPGFESQLPAHAALKPDLVVCLNPMENYILLHECGLHNIPTIGIIDTDADPTWVTYPIPGNDDSVRFSQVVAGVLGRAGQEGQERRLAQARKGVVTYKASHRLRAPTATERNASVASKRPQPSRSSLPAPAQAAQQAVDREDHLSGDTAGVAVAQQTQDRRLSREIDPAIEEEVSASNGTYQGDVTPLDGAKAGIGAASDPAEDDSIDPSLLENEYSEQQEMPSTLSYSEISHDRNIIKQSYGDNGAITNVSPAQAQSLDLDGYHVETDIPPDVSRTDLPSTAAESAQQSQQLVGKGVAKAYDPTSEDEDAAQYNSYMQIEVEERQAREQGVHEDRRADGIELTQQQEQQSSTTTPNKTPILKTVTSRRSDSPSSSSNQ